MTKKDILRGLAGLIVVAIIATCARFLPESYCAFATGFIGCMVVGIYGILIDNKIF
jgi:hypothetical protein